MADLDPATEEFRAALIDRAILVPTSVDGLFLRSEPFERTVRGLDALAHRLARGADETYEPPLYFPPIMPRAAFLKTDYLRSFPDLTGSIDVFLGSDVDHAELLGILDSGGDWTAKLEPGEVTLASAACHPGYERLTGTLPEGGRYLDIQGYCFRHEPSREPTRMQTFRMHELVHVGTPESAVAHRDRWLQRGLDALSTLGLDVRSQVANDPFFGRAGRMLKANQRDEALKFEILCDVPAGGRPVAISSANYHLDHFGAPFAIRSADGAVAHSACFGFGLERITLALFATHGLDVDGWPSDVTATLWG